MTCSPFCRRNSDLHYRIYRRDGSTFADYHQPDMELAHGVLNSMPAILAGAYQLVRIDADREVVLATHYTRPADLLDWAEPEKRRAKPESLDPVSERRLRVQLAEEFPLEDEDPTDEPKEEDETDEDGQAA